MSRNAVDLRHALIRAAFAPCYPRTGCGGIGPFHVEAGAKREPALLRLLERLVKKCRDRGSTKIPLLAQATAW
jgi:hypothetical protein